MNRMSIASPPLPRFPSFLWGGALPIGLLLLLVPGIGRAEPQPEEEAAAESRASEATEAVDSETAAASEEPLANTLKWSTASEVDNFGYDIFRSDQEEGPFERITDDPIPGAGTTDEPSFYEFADSDIDPSRAYFYYVESIALDGTRERFTPVIRAKAKRPIEGEAAPSEESSDQDGSESTEAPAEEIEDGTDPESGGSTR